MNNNVNNKSNTSSNGIAFKFGTNTISSQPNITTSNTTPFGIQPNTTPFGIQPNTKPFVFDCNTTPLNTTPFGIQSNTKPFVLQSNDNELSTPVNKMFYGEIPIDFKDNVTYPQKFGQKEPCQHTYYSELLVRFQNKMDKMEDKIIDLEKNKNRKCCEVIHTEVHCDNCKKNNITGIRHKCYSCVDYDLCDKCINFSEMVHPLNHYFIRITDTVKFNNDMTEHNKTL
jgi:hypothetical protein